MRKTVSFFSNFSALPVEIPFNQIINGIKEGTYKESVEEIRQATDMERRGALKRKLPHFTPSGTFNGSRSKDTLNQYSGLVILDFDKLGPDAPQIRNLAAEIDYTYAAFISPSGEGVKVIAQVDNGPDEHEKVFSQLANLYVHHLNVEVDKTGKDIPRACFVSYDPDLFFNESAKPFTLVSYTKIDSFREPTISDKRFQKAIYLTEEKITFTEGYRNKYIYYLANNCNRLGIDMDYALDFILSNYNLEGQEIRNTIKSAYKNSYEHGLNRHFDDPESKVARLADDEDKKRVFITARELLEKDIQELPKLIDPIIPKTGIAALVGPSDVGKSTFLNQLAYSVAYGDSEFLGFKINATHNRVIYVSTEDDENAINVLLKHQYGVPEHIERTQRLKFMFETDALIENLELELEKNPVDLIVIDAFADIYPYDLNANNQVRRFLHDFRNLAIKHNCLIMFLHHTGKNKEYLAPNKNNAIGSQGFEAKMRLMIEIRKDSESPELRHLCIVKGNYLPEEFKSHSYAMRFTEKRLFQNLDKRVPIERITFGQKTSNEEAKLRAAQLHKKGMTLRQIESQMATEGFTFKKTTIGEWLKSTSVRPED